MKKAEKAERLNQPFSKIKKAEKADSAYLWHYVTPFSVILAHFDTIFVTVTSLSDWGKSEGIFDCPSGAHIYR